MLSARIGCTCTCMPTLKQPCYHVPLRRSTSPKKGSPTWDEVSTPDHASYPASEDHHLRLTQKITATSPSGKQATTTFTTARLTTSGGDTARDKLRGSIRRPLYYNELTRHDLSDDSQDSEVISCCQSDLNRMHAIVLGCDSSASKARDVPLTAVEHKSNVQAFSATSLLVRTLSYPNHADKERTTWIDAHSIAQG